MTAIPSLFASLQDDILQHARSTGKAEACGLIANNAYWPCKNIHQDPESFFTLCPKDYIKATKKGDIQALFHSHASLDRFSLHDIKSCKHSNLPWLMYCMATDNWHYADPTGAAPYLGRQWTYGVHDCYGLVRDYYQNEFGIRLDDHERGEEFEWEQPGWNVFESNFESQGFFVCNGKKKKGDVLLMQLQAASPNHLGVIADSSTGVFYHHLLGRLSEANVYGGYWEKNTVKVLRHRELDHAD